MSSRRIQILAATALAVGTLATTGSAAGAAGAANGFEKLCGLAGGEVVYVPSADVAQWSDFGCDVASDDVTGFGLWGVCHGLGYDVWLRDVISGSIICVSA